MKTLLFLLTITIGCSSPPKRETLRSESGGKQSVIKDPSASIPGSSDAGNSGTKGQQSPTAGIPSPSGPQSPTQATNPATPSGTSPTSAVAAGFACPKSEKIGKSSKICETTIAGVKVKFVPLADGVKVSRISLYLHGDTAGDWKNPFVLRGMVEWAISKNVLLVASLSTARYDDDVEGDQSYGAAQPADADKLAKMLAEFIAAYQTPSDNILYWGVSGGPWFMTSSWIPKYGSKFPGLYALSCGASQNWQTPAWDYKDTAIRNKIKLFFNYGDQDFLKPNEEKSFDYYQKAGFVVSKKVYPGAEHCDHDVEQPTQVFWEANM